MQGKKTINVIIFINEKLMLSAVIVDDEVSVIYILADLLSKISFDEIKITGIAFNWEDGVEIIKKAKPDIIFLDINLSRKNGLEVFNEFKFPHFKIILCTAYQQYDKDALRIAAHSFLLKPEDFIGLEETLQKTSKEIIKEKDQFQFEEEIDLLKNPELLGENIKFDVENGFLIVNTHNIEYCYAKNSISVIVMYSQKEFLVAKSLKELQGILPDYQFYQTDKSYLW